MSSKTTTKPKSKRERLRPAFLGMKFTKSKSFAAKSGASTPLQAKSASKLDASMPKKAKSGNAESSNAKSSSAKPVGEDDLQATLVSSHESHAHQSPPKTTCAVCGPTPQKVFDILHGVCLLAVLATSVWNVVLTVQGKLDVQSMIPIFVTLFFAMLLLLPSQICGGVRTRAPSAWLSVCGSSITVIATGILVGYLIADPAYQPPISGTHLVEVDSNNLVKTHVAMPNGIGFGTTQLRVTK